MEVRSVFPFSTITFKTASPVLSTAQVKMAVRKIVEYHEANWLLVDCLNISEVSPEVRQEIEDTLILPISEIEKGQ
ncbi:MAG: hypothetical protein U7127_26375 [Phormidium sp.]